MNTIGSHPGAILFRLSIMVIVIAILIVIFFNYFEDTQRGIERQSMTQTKKIIDSSLAVVFASYAANGRLAELNELHGGNPFEFLQEFKILPPAYRGEIDVDLHPDLDPGWYYLRHRGLVGYKTYYLERDVYYSVLLNYDDVNRSGRFEPRADKFNNLQFVALLENPR